MPKRINVAFDIDGVVLDSLPTILHLLAMRLERPELADFKPTTFDFYQECGVAKKTCLACVKTMHDLSTFLKPIDGIVELIQEVHVRSDFQPILFVTTRDLESATTTYQALKRLLPTIPFSIAFTGSGIKHPDVDKLCHIRDYDYFVEDRRRTALFMLDCGKHVIMPRYSYNTVCDKVLAAYGDRLTIVDSIGQILSDATLLSRLVCEA